MKFTTKMVAAGAMLACVGGAFAQKGETAAVREMRRHAASYTKGLPFSAEYRMRFHQADTKEQMELVLQHYAARMQTSASAQSGT